MDANPGKTEVSTYSERGRHFMADGAEKNYLGKMSEQVDLLLVGPGNPPVRYQEVVRNLEETGKDYIMTVLDINKDCLDAVKGQTPEGRNVTYQQGNVVDAKLDGKFDMIDCLMTLCHLDSSGEIASAMRNMAGSLKQGGVLAVDNILHNKPEFSVDKIMTDQLLNDLGLILDREIPKEYSKGIPYLFYKKQ